MIRFPGCKINLGLHVLDKRADGYHNIETVFYPVNWFDVLEILPALNKTESFTVTGNALPGNTQDNLCLQAYRLLKIKYPALKPCSFHLHKNIPAGAGLGGGSSDATTTLCMLADIFKLPITKEELANIALQLGSDCPFFLHDRPMLAKGRGELLSPIQVDLKKYHVLLVNPGIHVPTPKAFSMLQPTRNDTRLPLPEIVQQPVENWRLLLQNDFEEPIFNLHPQMLDIKKNLYKNGALYAAMSGSGSTIFGIFTRPFKVKNIFPATYICHWA